MRTFEFQGRVVCLKNPFTWTPQCRLARKEEQVRLRSAFKSAQEGCCRVSRTLDWLGLQAALGTITPPCTAEEMRTSHDLQVHRGQCWI
jgi:hypothetical protein